MNKIKLTCESTVDVPYSLLKQYDIDFLYYGYLMGGKYYEDNLERSEEVKKAFYDALEKGTMPTTSQINEFKYEEFFRGMLEQGYDVIHVCFGTGMTRSYDRAYAVAEKLKAEFPNNKIEVIDSLCSSTGYGMLVLEAKDLLDKGNDFETVVNWVNDNKKKLHHQFYASDLTFFRRSGRMSGPVATLANMFKIKPLLHLDETGHIIAYDKVRGTQNAMKATVKAMTELADNGINYDGWCFINHSNCIEEAKALKEEVIKTFPKLKSENIRICDIGETIVSHCGPGVVALFFHGAIRK